MPIKNSLTEADLPRLYEIERECFTKEFRWSRSVFDKALLQASRKNNVWIAEEDGIIVGFLLAGKDGLKGDIETVDIAKAYRGRGIASKLITSCEKDFRKRGVPDMKLEVWVENPALLLYHKLGYRISGFRRHYYRLHRHAVTMTKKL